MFMVQDPLPCNELGCLLFRAKNYDAAERWLSRALERMPGRLNAGQLSCIVIFPIEQCSRPFLCI